MNQKIKISTGDKFGKLVIIDKAEPHISPGGKASSRFFCMCECGNQTVAYRSSLIKGNTKSCGCIRRSKVTKHGLAGHPLNNVWSGMKTRCYNPNINCFSRYGGRGIRVCAEWLNDFQAFYNWATNNGYQKGLEIDRINNDGDYAPGNCQFVSNKKNARNRISTSLNDESVKNIRELRKVNNWGAKKIADFLKIKKHLIEDVIYGRSWLPENSGGII